MHKTCSLYIDEQSFQFDVEGDFFWGSRELLYNETSSIISKMEWESDGFGIVDVFTTEEFTRLKESIKAIILNILNENDVKVNSSEFQLHEYHKYVTTDELHQKIIGVTSNLETSDFNFDIDELAKRFGDILGFDLTSWIKELNKSYVLIRISRPDALDINPPHKDGYLSYWEHIVNVWLPISGCNEKSSLPVMKGSHKLFEDKILRTGLGGAKINGNTYHVPCILETKKGAIQMTRPNPKEGQALVFTPYLIHGAAVNQNNDTTRISLELRFPKSE